METNERLKKELTKTKAELKDCEERFRVLAENTEMSIYIIQGKHFVYVSPGMEKVTGFSEKELLSMSFWEVVHPDHQETIRERGLSRQEGKDVPLRYEFKIRTKSGEERWFEIVNKTFVFREKPATLGTAMEITERKRVEENLKRIGFRDNLTGLYNRFYFEEEEKRLEASRRFPVSVIFIDVDGLRAVNNNYGHDAGDKLLRRAAKVLLSVFRPEDCIARTGGDEFVVLLPGVNEVNAKKNKKRLEDSLKKHNLAYPLFPLSFSSGIATAQKDDLLEEVIRVADQEMYAEKRQKKEKNK